MEMHFICLLLEKAFVLFVYVFRLDCVLRIGNLEDKDVLFAVFLLSSLQNGLTLFSEVIFPMRNLSVKNQSSLHKVHFPPSLNPGGHLTLLVWG